jgi:hypothetical protein
MGEVKWRRVFDSRVLRKILVPKEGCGNRELFGVV